MINLLKGSQGAHVEVCHSIWEMREQESCTIGNRRWISSGA